LPVEKKTTPEDNKSTSGMTIPRAARIYAEGRREGNFFPKISKGNETGKENKTPSQWYPYESVVQ
jgi:hypothetical protein